MSIRVENPLSLRRTPPRFCQACGQPLTIRVPPGDGRERPVCASCGFIGYENPKMVVGCIPLFAGRILLCRRAIEPRYGCWTLPAGFMENGETTAAGAARETFEEAGASVRELVPFMLIDVPDVHQVHVFFTALLESDRFEPGEESLEARLFAEGEIPWAELSFPTVIAALRQFYADRAGGSQGFHRATIGKATRG